MRRGESFSADPNLLRRPPEFTKGYQLSLGMSLDPCPQQGSATQLIGRKPQLCAHGFQPWQGQVFHGLTGGFHSHGDIQNGWFMSWNIPLKYR